MDGNSRFSLRKADLGWFRKLEPALRNLLKIPDLNPEDLIGLARAIRCIQRLPRCTLGIDVSVSLHYRTDNFVSHSTVRLSCDELSAEDGAASRLQEGDEYESFPSFTLRIDRNGEYEVEGDKQEFFTDFIGSAESISDAQGCTVSVVDDSAVQALPSCEDEAI